MRGVRESAGWGWLAPRLLLAAAGLAAAVLGMRRELRLEDEVAGRVRDLGVEVEVEVIPAPPAPPTTDVSRAAPFDVALFTRCPAEGGRGWEEPNDRAYRRAPLRLVGGVNPVTVSFPDPTASYAVRCMGVFLRGTDDLVFWGSVTDSRSDSSPVRIEPGQRGPYFAPHAIRIGGEPTGDDDAPPRLRGLGEWGGTDT